MIFQATAEQTPRYYEFLHAVAEWAGLALIMWGFKLSAKRDVKQRHDENKKLQETALANQKKILDDLETEREFLPQHWHAELDQLRFGGTAKALSTDGVIRRPTNGKSNK